MLLYLEKKENDFPFIYIIDRTVKIGFHLECGSYRAISKLQAKWKIYYPGTLLASVPSINFNSSRPNPKSAMFSPKWAYNGPNPFCDLAHGLLSTSILTGLCLIHFIPIPLLASACHNVLSKVESNNRGWIKGYKPFNLSKFVQLYSSLRRTKPTLCVL